MRWFSMLFACIPLIFFLGKLWYEDLPRVRIKKNRELIERGYGFLLDKEQRDEVLNEGDVEVLKPFQKPTILSQIKRTPNVMILAIITISLSACASSGGVQFEERYVKKGASEDDIDLAKARCRMGLAGLSTSSTTNVVVNNPGFTPAYPMAGQQLQQLGQATSNFGASMGTIAADSARSERYFHDCMLVQGFKSTLSLALESHYLSPNVFTTTENADVKSCKFVTAVQGHSFFHGIFQDEALASAATTASRQASAINADTLLVTGIHSSDAAGTDITGDAYICKQ